MHLLVRHAADPGFPSDHATAAFAIATTCSSTTAGGIAVLVAAVLLAVDRVAVGVHYPADVLAGALLGAGVAAVLYVPIAGRLSRYGATPAKAAAGA